MPSALPPKDIAVSMRLRAEDLAIIDQGAVLSGLSRTEFMRRAAVVEAQNAILNQNIIRLSPDAFEAFVAAIEMPAGNFKHVPPKDD